MQKSAWTLRKMKNEFDKKGFLCLVMCIIMSLWLEWILSPCNFQLEQCFKRVHYQISRNSSHKLSSVGGAARAQWIRLRLPFCRPGFESKANHLSFYFIYSQICAILSLYCEKNENKKKRLGLAHFLQKLSSVGGFVGAYHPAVQGLNPKHPIYALIVKFCTVFVVVMRKGRKQTKRGRFGTHLFNTSNKEISWAVVVAQVAVLVSSDTRDPQFESSHQQCYLATINCIEKLYWKDENK